MRMNLSIHVVKITQYELWNWNFRYDVWPQGHLPTNYTKWRTAKAMYTVSDIQSTVWKPLNLEDQFLSNARFQRAHVIILWIHSNESYIKFHNLLRIKTYGWGLVTKSMNIEPLPNTVLIIPHCMYVII